MLTTEAPHPEASQAADRESHGRVMPARSALLRLNDHYEVYAPADPAAAQREGARCMSCGAAFCVPDSGYGAGCPIHNRIPEWNVLVSRGRWREAFDRLTATNPFPEFTSRVCPAPCQDACIHGINEQPIQIKGIERAIVDRAFDEGWVRPRPPAKRSGRSIAIVGSGPAGLAAAERLNRLGHYVCVLERDDRIGGLLTYGIPTMKLDKRLVERRVQLLAAEGIRFRTGTGVTADDLPGIRRHYDAVLLACGTQRARDLPLPGRDLGGVVQAMPYLTAATRQTLDGDRIDPEIDAHDRDVVVIGGGDTGADCIATTLRHGCRSVVNITRRDQPPHGRSPDHPWPGPTGAFTIDYAHAEAAARFGEDPRAFQIEPRAFVPDATRQRVAGLIIRRLDTGEEDVLPAQLVILAIGFTGSDAGVTPAHQPVDGHRSAAPGVYVAGDCRRGPSLVVWAIRDGRDAANAIHDDLMHESPLEARSPRR
jgi:glutamate synthase (NADPH/NADH) small chain